MTNPSGKTLRAAATLWTAHANDDIVIYANEKEDSAVIVINDPDILEVAMVLMNFVTAKQKGDSEEAPFIVALAPGPEA